MFCFPLFLAFCGERQPAELFPQQMQQQLRLAQCWGQEGDVGQSSGHGEGSSGAAQGRLRGAPEECSAHSHRGYDVSVSGTQGRR